MAVKSEERLPTDWTAKFKVEKNGKKTKVKFSFLLKLLVLIISLLFGLFNERMRGSCMDITI